MTLTVILKSWSYKVCQTQHLRQCQNLWPLLYSELLSPSSQNKQKAKEAEVEEILSLSTRSHRFFIVLKTFKRQLLRFSDVIKLDRFSVLKLLKIMLNNKSMTWPIRLCRIIFKLAAMEGFKCTARGHSTASQMFIRMCLATVRRVVNQQEVYTLKL